MLRRNGCARLCACRAAAGGALAARLAPTSEDVVAIDGARVTPLPRLIELKLVSGTSAPGSRRKDLADVYALIAANRLPREYAYEVDCSVREAYCKIWDDWQESRKSGLDP
jgi:hypothetical protein